MTKPTRRQTAPRAPKKKERIDISSRTAILAVEQDDKILELSVIQEPTPSVVVTLLDTDWCFTLDARDTRELGIRFLRVADEIDPFGASVPDLYLTTTTTTTTTERRRDAGGRFV